MRTFINMWRHKHLFKFEDEISRRGAAPDGGGEVIFSCPCRQKLRPIKFTQPGKIKRIRGVAWSARISPGFVNRLVDSARGVLNQFLTDIYIYTDHMKGSQAGKSLEEVTGREVSNKFLTDIYIYTDHMKGSQAGKSPGFGLTLVAETTEGAFLAAEQVSNAKGSGEEPSVPEDLGRKAATCLLQEIYRGGCVDSTSQGLACLLMVLGQQDVSKIQTGELTPYSIQFLRHIRDFFQVVFNIKVDKKTTSAARGDGTNEGEGEEEELKIGGDKLILTCVGVGYSNVSKAIR
ncbi:RNA 3'-terminal phosphate cyclase-like protein [Plakobranchus ocellatus]|uniref:RNA 3'-terminal phosphate cyclase-like protein n=1 Tax=Plakobranchus ocellatus TaxID=259542 RepID=A0AAV3ZQ67_9GAST|nr:RNA 3'-terminal phosphate cyclase-like protein [Plakobranchus ocellatus]